MKNIAIGLLVLTLVFAAGCSPFPNVDREFGKVTQSSLKRQVAFPEGRNVQKIPEGMAGITAEQVMNIYNQTYAEKPKKDNTFSLQFVSGGENGQ